jgi:hypothetical protein
MVKNTPNAFQTLSDTPNSPVGQNMERIRVYFNFFGGTKLWNTVGRSREYLRAAKNHGSALHQAL